MTQKTEASASLALLLSGNTLRCGESSSFGGLTLIPLFTKHRGQPEYTLISDAISEGTATIEEVGTGSVPSLRVANGWNKPVLLVDGEHLVGVKQNRILNTTILVPEKSSLNIPVSCVEQGRWGAPRRIVRSESPHLFASARAKKAEAVTKSVRATGMYAADQAEIWEAVALTLEYFDVSSPSRGMDELYRTRGADVEKYLAHHRWREGQTGVVAGVGTSIVCADLFDRPETLHSLWKRLVASYAIEALKEGAKGSVGIEEARGFIWEASQAAVTTHSAIGRGIGLRLSSDRIVGAALEADETIVHLALFRKFHQREDHGFMH